MSRLKKLGLLNREGTAACNEGRNKYAMFQLVQADSIARSLKSPLHEAKVRNNIGLVHHVAGHLHDIGKIGVPDHMLRKDGPLEPGEWRAIRRHPEAGADILRSVAALKKLGVVDMVLHHHERYDGKGYPKGLKGAQIPLGARIIALAESLSAILQNRPYRSARGFSDAMNEIVRCSGSQFDPRVVDAFLKSSETIKGIIEALSDVEVAA